MLWEVQGQLTSHRPGNATTTKNLRIMPATREAHRLRLLQRCCHGPTWLLEPDQRRRGRGPAGGVQLSGLQRPKPLVVSDDASRTGGVIDQMSRNLHAIVMQFYARSCVGHVVWTTLQPIRLRESESGRSSGSCRAHLPSRVRLKKKSIRRHVNKQGMRKRDVLEGHVSMHLFLVCNQIHDLWHLGGWQPLPV